MQTALFSLGLVAGALTLGSLLGRFHWTLDVLSHFHMQYTLLLIVAILGLLWLRTGMRRMLWLLPALLINLALLAPFFATGTRPAEAAGSGASTPLRVMSMNISTSTAGYPQVVELIRAQEPDIVYLSEVRPDLVALLQAEVGDAYPVQYAEPSRMTLGVAILARNPDVRVQTVSFENDVGRMARRYLRAEFEWHGTPVTLAGIHPLPPMRGAWTVSRDHEIETMRELALEIGQPFVLVGDFNASPWSRPMRALKAQTDLDYAGGWRSILPTWFIGSRAAALIFGAPLDHILTSSEWREQDFQRLPDIRSDHVPLQAEFVLSE